MYVGVVSVPSLPLVLEEVVRVSLMSRGGGRGIEVCTLYFDLDVGLGSIGSVLVD